MSTVLRPTRFSLVGLSLLDVGPLRGSTSISFLDESEEPTNLYLIMGPNGAGKTTILEAIYTAMALLESKTHPSEILEGLGEEGGIQLDAIVQLDDGQRSTLRLLSIVAGKPGRLRNWKKEELQRHDVEGEQIALHYARGGVTNPVTLKSGSSDPDAIAFLDAIIEGLGEPPLSLFGGSMNLPTILYFPSERGIMRPPSIGRAIVRPEAYAYRPAHRFGLGDDRWAESIENLLVWFTWLDPDLEKACRDAVNKLVFRGGKRLRPVHRRSLEVPVETETGTHRLDQLSSGERQLVQLVVRVAAHMTGSTIVLIDETEQHLHTVMRRRLINMIKDWARDYDGLAFVMTSHQVDSMRMLAPKRPEEGLSKGGCLVKSKFVLPNE